MLQKENFTKLRDQQLKILNHRNIITDLEEKWGKLLYTPLDHNNTITDLEKKWGKLLYTPLDIPVIKDELFAEWYFQNAKPIVKTKPDVADPEIGWSSFVSVNVHSPLVSNSTVVECLEKLSKWSLNIHQDWFVKFPKMYQQIMDTLPFNDISNINMWSSTMEIGAHIDHSTFIDIPLSFRIMVYDENPNTTLYTGECLPDVPWDANSSFYCKFPESTNTFVWNNLRTRHGSLHNPGYRKILLIVSGTNINWKKYDELLDRSVNKFSGEYCLFSKKNIDEFIIT